MASAYSLLVKAVEGIALKAERTQLYAAIYRDGVEIQRTRTIQREITPNWDYFAKISSDLASSTISLRVFYSSVPQAHDHCLGAVDINLPELAKRCDSGRPEKQVVKLDLTGVDGESKGQPAGSVSVLLTSSHFSSDRARISSLSADKTPHGWDAEVGALVAGPFRGHSIVVSSVQFSPDGARIASASWDSTVCVWNAHTGALDVGPLTGHTNSVNSVHFSPDGTRIASGSSDNTVRVWNAYTGALIAGPFNGHTNSINSVHFSPDGTRIASGSWDTTVRVWDAQTGALVGWPFTGHTNSVNSVQFSPDGARIASASWDRTMWVWDAATGARVVGPLEGHTDSVSSVCFSPNGRRIASGSFDNTVRVWDARTGTLLAGPLSGHTKPVASVCFSPNGTRIASGSFDNTVRVWDAQTGALYSDPLDALTNGVTSVHFSPDGAQIATGSQDRTVCVWAIDRRETPSSRLLEDLLLRQNNQADNSVGIGAALRALTWISEKYNSASLALPLRVTMYMENLLEHINSGAQLRIPRNADSPDEAETPHIASAFLIERTHDTEGEDREDSSYQPCLRLNDFNGRQADVPLALCKSWPDLCIFLDIFLDGDKESHFITSGNFGLRVPTQKELLSRESWNLWVSHLNKDAGKLPVTLDLYAIMWDASDRCPQCKIQNPVKHPLPDDLQRCVKCQFAFLESYQDMETIPETPTMPSTAALTRTTNHDYLRNLQPQTPDDSEYQDGTSIPAVPSTSKSPDVSKTTEPLASVSPETRHCLDIPGPDVADELSFSYPPVPSTQVSGPPSLPKHVQVLRQRKPFQQDSQDDQSSLISTAQPLSATSLDTPHPMLQTPTTYLGFLYKLYTSVLLGLPHRYYKDAPQPRTLGGDDPGTAPALYKRWTDEWTQMGSIAVVLFGLLFTVLQISSVSYDVVVRTVVWLSMVCLFFGATFAIILSLIFRKLATKTVGVRWIREVTRPPKNHFWNARIMLSMPAVWIIWGVVYFAIFMLVFLWRSGATNEKDEHLKPSPSQEYGPRAFTTFVFVLGVAYLMLILRTATKIGGERMI